MGKPRLFCRTDLRLFTAFCGVQHEIRRLAAGLQRAGRGIRGDEFCGGADMGIVIASDWMFAPELAAGSVCKLLPDWQLPEIDLWALFPAGRMISAKARRFADFVEAVMGG